MTKVKTFYFNDLRECTYIVYDDTKECVIVDPGMQNDNEKQRLVKFIETNGLKPVKLLLTHGHFDHVMGNAFVVGRWDIPTYIHREDIGQMERAKQYCQMFGMMIEEPPTDNLVELEEGRDVTFGNTRLQVIHTPGHTRGGVCFYCEEEKFVLVGDTLFQGSIGRTDLPGGDYDALMQSLLGKLCKKVDHRCTVYPGHGPETSLGIELETNPFLRME